MTVELPEDLIRSIRAEVLSGRFASEEQLVAAAVREYLHRTHNEVAPGATPQTGVCADDAELQRCLFEAGVLSEVKRPITDLAPYRDRQAVPIRGEPLSETIVRERR
jgi:Arc/MetJ-type ribon-helix-helix transcriptional regulator